ncbi:MAG: nitrous oxide reductase accessory protein NosL [Flavobacteriaceae bacterium]|jgi:copper chaperone NosL|nr:nitrous oxide reductase accessory protein NosL [Flavobacteriaceae bacterium]
MLFKNIIILTFASAFLSCQPEGPREIAVGKDQCDNCKMTIEDLKYAAELVTAKGKPYKFDDISCMTMFQNSNADIAKNAKTYAIDFKTSKFVETEKAFFIKGGKIRSPMGGNTQAFSNKADAEKAAKELDASFAK